jgi:hypothetical protein
LKLGDRDEPGAVTVTNVAWKTEDGEVLGEADYPHVLLSDRFDLSRTVCLRFLDPYGDTMFNQVQLPVLAEELELVASKAKDKDVRAHLLEVAGLARRAMKQVHTYLWFSGD